MTDRKQTNAKLIHNLGFSLDEVITKAFDAVIVINEDQKIIYFNQGAESTFGYTADEVLERPLDILLPDRFVELHRWHVKGFLASHDNARPMGKDIRAITALRQDGTEFPAEATIVKITAKETNRPYMGVIIRDITLQKKLEYELSHISSHLTAAQRQAQLGSWEWYPESNNLWWSDGFYALLGLSPGKTSFGLDTFLGMTHPNDIDNLFQTLARASVDPEKYIEHPELFSNEFRIILPDGNVRWVYSKGAEKALDPQKKVFIRGFIQDVTERKQSLLQLEESERRFRQLAENIQEVFWMYDPIHEQMAYISPAYEEVWGRSCENLYAAPRSFLEAIHPDDRPSVFEALERQLNGEKSEVEYRVVQPDGKIRWVWDRGFPIFDDTGRVILVCGIAADITQRKQADALIRYQANLVENVNDAIISSDNQFNVLSWNKAAEKIYGWQAEECSGKQLGEMIKTTYPNDQAKDVYKEFLDQGYWRGEVIQTRKDGSPINVSASFTTLTDQDGNVIGAVAINRDITEQVRAKADYQVLFDEAPAMYVITHVEGKKAVIEDCNNLFLSKLNYARSEVIGRKLGDFYTPASRREHINKWYKEILMVDSYAAERQFVTRSGQVIDTLLESKQVFDASGAVIGTRAMYVDISERKQAEREREKLLNQVKAGHEELRLLSTRLVEIQEDERSNLARELHDEVGQTLTGLTYILERSLSSEGDMLKANLEQSRNLVKQLLDNIRNISLNLRPSMLDDFGLFAALLWQIDQYTSHTQIQVDFKQWGVEQRFSPKIETAAYRIVQEALTNVARHAGVREVSVYLQCSEDRLTIRVEDHGRGFSHKEVSEKGFTSGLTGLRERVLFLGGSLTLESQPGKGTSLTAVLPLTVTGIDRDKEVSA